MEYTILWICGQKTWEKLLPLKDYLFLSSFQILRGNSFLKERDRKFR